MEVSETVTDNGQEESSELSAKRRNNYLCLKSRKEQMVGVIKQVMSGEDNDVIRRNILFRICHDKRSSDNKKIISNGRAGAMLILFDVVSITPIFGY